MIAYWEGNTPLTNLEDYTREQLCSLIKAQKAVLGDAFLRGVRAGLERAAARISEEAVDNHAGSPREATYDPAGLELCADLENLIRSIDPATVEDVK